MNSKRLYNEAYKAAELLNEISYTINYYKNNNSLNGTEAKKDIAKTKDKALQALYKFSKAKQVIIKHLSRYAIEESNLHDDMYNKPLKELIINNPYPHYLSIIAPEKFAERICGTEKKVTYSRISDIISALNGTVIKSPACLFDALKSKCKKETIKDLIICPKEEGDSCFKIISIYSTRQGARFEMCFYNEEFEIRLDGYYNEDFRFTFDGNGIYLMALLHNCDVSKYSAVIGYFEHNNKWYEEYCKNFEFDEYGEAYIDNRRDLMKIQAKEIY